MQNNKENLNNLKHELEQFNWEQVTQSTDVNVAYDNL